MSLRKKLALFIVLSTFAYTAIILVIVQIVLINEIEGLEVEKQKSNMERIESALNERMDNLARFTSDYAGWDDTYSFIEDRNQAYVEENMVDETFTSSGIELVAYINNSKEIVYEKAFDTQTKTQVVFPKELAAALRSTTVLTSFKNENDSVKGMLNTHNGVLMLTSSPIVTSARQGPIKGAMIMGVFLNKPELDKLYGITKLAFGIVTIDSSNALPPEAAQEDLHIVSNNAKTITGYKQFKDIYGNTVFTAVLTEEKSFLAHAISSSRFLTGMLGIIGVVTIIVGLIFMDAIAVKPIKHLAQNVRNITANGDLSIKLKQSGGPEIKSLTADINRMIENIQISEQKLKDSNTVLTQKSAELEKTNKLMINRELKMIQLKGEVEKLKEQVNDERGN